MVGGTAEEAMAAQTPRLVVPIGGHHAQIEALAGIIHGREAFETEARRGF